MKNITITYNKEKYEFEEGVRLFEIAKNFKNDFKNKIIIGEVDGRLSELNTQIYSNSKIKFYDRNSIIGNLIYQNGFIFVLIKAFKDVLNEEIIIKHSIDSGILFTTNNSITKEKLARVSIKMEDIIKKNLKIEKHLVDRLEAINYYKKRNNIDKVNILKYTTNTNVNLYKLGTTYDYFFSYLPISTGYLEEFLLSYIDKNNFVLSFKNIYTDKEISYKHHKGIYNEFNDFSDFSSNIGIENISDVNNMISNGKYEELILLSENYQNNRLYNIAKNISENEDIKLVLISGPSSSGKTTTSKKLELYLKSFNLNPIAISIDDYFVDREDTPKKEDGTYDFESLDAIDINLFNDNLKRLLNNEEVNVPTYNFIEGKKEYNKTLKLSKNEIIIVEGLHSLNNKLTKSIARNNKFKIYLGPLTVLNLDNHNRFKMTDNRILRRIVRDNRLRGYNASKTINYWNSVREGEEKYIFPFQDDADVIFNTSLLYEINVLKTYAEPLLYSVEENDEAYKEALRLLNLLKNILPMPSELVPKDSIIREFIGNGYFSD